MNTRRQKVWIILFQLNFSYSQPTFPNARGITSNLIGSLSLTNGHCPPPGKWIMKQWPAGVNSRFVEVTEKDILRMQDITFPNDTKKATKLGMKVFRDKQCFNWHNLLTCPSSSDCSVLIAKLRWCCSPWTTTVLPQLHFKVPSKSTRLPLSKTSPFSKIWMSLSLSKMIVISNTPTAST